MEESKAFLEKADKLLAAITVNGENVLLLCDARRLIAEAYKEMGKDHEYEAECKSSASV